jgi:hypothetical protein
MLLLTCAAAILASAQQPITTHDIGAFAGNIAYPPGPICPADTVTFTGNVNVVAQVDLSQNTIDIHLNLQDVKGIGDNGTYVANGAADVLSQPYSTSITVPSHANLFPPSPCRSGFNSQGALPITVVLSFDENNVLTKVSGSTGCTTDVCSNGP